MLCRVVSCVVLHCIALYCTALSCIVYIYISMYIYMYLLYKQNRAWWANNIISHTKFHVPYNMVTLFPAGILITRIDAVQMAFSSAFCWRKIRDLDWILPKCVPTGSLHNHIIVVKSQTGFYLNHWRKGPLMHPGIDKPERVELIIWVIDFQTLEISKYSLLLDNSFIKPIPISLPMKYTFFVQYHQPISFDKDNYSLYVLLKQ